MGTILGIFGSENITISSDLKDLKSAIVAANGEMPEPIKSDGWGVGFYQHGTAYLIKKSSPFEDDDRIDTLTEKISSNIFLSQIRQATVGEIKVANTQPFRYGAWLFAHQGSIEQFRRIKPKLKKALHPPLVRKMQGVTDSEHCFCLFLSLLKGAGYLKGYDIPIGPALSALTGMLSSLTVWAQESNVEEPSNYNCILSNGSYILTVRKGPALYFKNIIKQLSRQTGESSAGASGAPAPRILISSHKFGIEKGWEYIPNDSFLIIDRNLRPEFMSIPSQPTG